MSRTHLGQESGNLDRGASPAAPRPADWDYPTTKVSAVELRAKIAERRSNGAGGGVEHASHVDHCAQSSTH